MVRHLSHFLLVLCLAFSSSLQAGGRGLRLHTRAVAVLDQALEAIGTIASLKLADQSESDQALREVVAVTLPLRDQSIRSVTLDALELQIKAQEDALGAAINAELRGAMDAPVEGLRGGVVRPWHRLAGLDALVGTARFANINLEQETHTRRSDLKHATDFIRGQRAYLPAELGRIGIEIHRHKALFDRFGLSPASAKKIAELEAQFATLTAEIGGLGFSQPESDAFAEELKNKDKRLRAFNMQAFLLLSSALEGLAPIRAQFDAELAQTEMAPERRQLLESEVKRQFELLADEWQDVKYAYDTEEGAAEIKKIADEILISGDGPFYDKGAVEKLQRRAFLVWIKSTNVAFHAYPPEVGSLKMVQDFLNKGGAIAGGFGTLLGGFFGYLWAINTHDYAALKVLGPMIGGGGPLWTFLTHHGLANHRNKKSRARLEEAAAGVLGANEMTLALCEFRAQARVKAEAEAELRGQN